MQDILDRVGKVLLERRLLPPGARGVLAVSGGLDSMVLLAVMEQLALKHQWRLVVAHFNHELRGAESDADQAFVEAAAKNLGLPCVCERGAVKTHAAAEHLSMEMAARALRHAFLARVATACSCDTVALAHHADDQVETFFLRLLRGTGGEGLGGMRWESPSPADRAIRLVRPLLGEPKAALEAFARAAGVAHREDRTNQHSNILRNRIRRELLPLLRRRFQPGLDAAVGRAAELVRAEADYAGGAARVWLKGEREGGFDDLHLAVQRRVIQQQLIALGCRVGFELVERLRTEVEERIMIEPGRQLWRDASGSVHLQAVAASDHDPAIEFIDASVGQGALEFGGARVEWTIEQVPPGREAYPQHTPGEERFDADAVGNRISLRHWQPGDRFQPIGMGNAVKLQDMFTDMKVPADERRRRIVVASEACNIFWVEGLRIGEAARLRPGTRRILRWRWSRFAN